MSLDELRARLVARRDGLRARRVVVLTGGASAEREVSLSSGRSVADALGSAGYAAELATVEADSPLAFAAAAGIPALAAHSTAGNAAGSDLMRGASELPIVVNMLHGAEGEDGTWQGLLALLNLPHTSASVKGSALAMDKAISKRLFEHLGIPTPQWAVVSEEADSALAREQFTGLGSGAELVAKPVDEGSSVGLLIFSNDNGGWNRLAAHAAEHGQLLIERRVAGRELTVAVIGTAAAPCSLPIVEIVPASGVYDYEHKYTAGACEYLCPAKLDTAAAERIASDSRRIFSSLELGPCARIDLILEGDLPWFLEANTQPGFTGTSLLPKAAAAVGVSYLELLELLMLLGIERWEAAGGNGR